MTSSGGYPGSLKLGKSTKMYDKGYYHLSKMKVSISCHSHIVNESLYFFFYALLKYSSVFFVLVEALRNSQQFFRNVGAFSWVEPVLSNGDEVPCSRTQQRAPGDI